MDPGRYALQQGWDTNSALEGYAAVHEQDYRAGGSGGRKVPDEGFSRDSIYSRNAYQGQMLDRDIYPPVQASSMWPQSRRRNIDDEESLNNDSRRSNAPFHDIDSFHDPKKYHEIDRFHDRYRHVDSYHDIDGYGDYPFERHARSGTRDRDEIDDHYDLRRRGSYGSRENSRERDYDTGRYDYESDQDRGRRESSWRRHDSREPERGKRGLSWDRSQSPYDRHYDSRSRGRDDRSRSRSPEARNGARSYRENIYDDKRYDRNEKRRDYDHDEKHYNDVSVTPSATVVVKGLSLKTTEEDLYHMLAEWGPIRHVRVIKERSSGVSRGFAFIDFPSVEAACCMMAGIGENGLAIDGRRVLFEYSSKPTGGAGAPALRQEGLAKSGYGYGRSVPPSDWICIICSCVNFARRISCFQCNEPRTDDAPSGDMAPSLLGRKGSDSGPTHVLVVRGLDDNADEEMLRYEFAKHAPIKDIRLVRDKFTHVSRGFAFLHFHSVEDAAKALEATNGTTLEKNGQILRVAYAKSIHGPFSGTSQSSSLAAAAIEAATFAQQYDSVGWAPKEYNPDKQSTDASEQKSSAESHMGGSAPQAGFVWDEKSGYYYDASSGFYYDGNTGLYYDGNNGIWYTYDNQNQQYVPCANQGNTKASGESTSEVPKASIKKVVISAPASTIKSNEGTSLPDAVQAAASAALAAERKEKEKQKEIKLASKNNLLASKKKMNNVLAIWKQRNSEGQAARVVLEDNEQPGSTDDKHNSSSYNVKNKSKANSSVLKEAPSSSGLSMESQVKARPVSSSTSGTIMGVIRGSGRGVIRADTTFSVSSSLGASSTLSPASTSTERIQLAQPEPPKAVTPFKTDASALSYTPPPLMAAGSGKRRFSETPMQANQPQTAYRDRAAERRSRYGSHSTDNLPGDLEDLNCEHPSRKGHLSDMGAMPFPPGVGGGRTSGDLQSYEVITADRTIDENNVGNRMLRSMGWQEGLGLGKDGSGIKEPVQARAVDDRAGLGSQLRKSLDQSLEAKPGDSYRTIIHKKAIARFREMS